MREVWDKTLFSIREQLDTHQYNHWFKPIEVAGLTDREIVLKVPDRFFRDWLQDNYIELLRTTLAQEASRELDIKFTWDGDLRRPPVPAEVPDPLPSGNLPLDPRYTFDSFVVGSSNQFAHAACAAVADDPGRNYNPLFIYGGVGLGKTHLLHAIGNQILAQNPKAKIQYFASETYINDLISSIRSDRMDEFRAKYRQRCDVLLVDDIQFIAGKDRTQIEFFHTFNSLYADHKQIVVTSDRSPHEISGLEERLKSRFQWGLIADVQPPELETRVAILKAKAISEDIDLPEDLAMFVAQHVKSNVRELEGCLVRLAAHSRLHKAPLSLALARVVLKDLLHSPGPTITVPQIQKAVASFYNVTVSDLKGARRHRAIALPRMIAMFLARKHTPCSFPEIGKRFGGRDHSTVISAVKKIQKQVDGSDQPTVRAIADLERSLNV